MGDLSTTREFAPGLNDVGSRRIRLLEAIGNTPLFELVRLSEEVAPVRIYAKAEWYNPGGSVKDRAALNMILDGENSGRLSGKIMNVKDARQQGKEA